MQVPKKIILSAAILSAVCVIVAYFSQDISAIGGVGNVPQSQKTNAQQRPTSSTLPISATVPNSPCSPTSKTSFSDDKFPLSDWNSFVLPGISTPGYTATNMLTGGNSADFLNIQISIPPNAPNRNFAHLLKGYTFDPATEGTIASIDGGYDLKNQIPGGSQPTLYALLLNQNGVYYRGPSNSASANTWTAFNHTGLKATDFVNVSSLSPKNPDFSCTGKPIQVGFVTTLSTTVNAKLISSGIDNWSIHFNTTCCSNPTVPGNSEVSRGASVSQSGRPVRTTVKSKCCCDDNKAVVDKDGTVILPDNVDMDSPPVFEYVDQEVGDVKDLYPGADTTTDTWYKDYPCETAIGGIVPKEAETPNLDIELEKMGINASAEEIKKQLDNWENIIAQNTPLRVRWDGPAAPDYTPPATPYKPPSRHPAVQGEIKYAFGGRDIIFVHGLKLEHIFNRMGGKPAAQVNWKNPTSFPANLTNPEFYTGYYKNRANVTWAGDNGDGSHIAEFLTKNGFKNRYLIVSYNCSERLDVAARAILAQIGDAMKFGIGVVDPLKPNGPPPQNFGTPSFVIVSHSTGGLVTDVAMTAAAQVPSLNAAYIPQYCKAHIAAHGVHRGSRFATGAIALSGYASIQPTNWLWPLIRPVLVELNKPNPVPTSLFGIDTMASSILVDLVPLVSQGKWGRYVKDHPVRTLTVVGGHPTFLWPFKFIFHPGFDDGVSTINSQVANPNNTLLLPSGFSTDPLTGGLIKNFDMGVFGIGPNFQVQAKIGGNLVSFTVNITNTSLNSPSRAIGYYLNQKFDRFISSPGNVLAFPYISPLSPHFFAAGATPYISPTGMLQTISAEYGSGQGDFPLSANPLNRSPNHFSFLQSASDHFKGTHDQVLGFNGNYYGNSPLYWASGEKNFEETRVITSQKVYDQVVMPYGDNEPLLRPANIPQVVERIRGLRVTFTLKVFKKKYTRSLWVWKRRYHLLDEWETKRQFNYVYDSILKN